METRALGNTGLQVPRLSYGTSWLGNEFGRVDPKEAMKVLRVALDHGMNYIDTSPYYGRGMSEMLLGFVLREIPRDDYMIGTKLGRYDVDHFDFSAKRVAESVDVSLHRLGVDYLDVCLCHDIEFVDIAQIWEETLPALRKVQEAGKVKHVGISGYPMRIFEEVLAHADLDVMLSYNHYTLQSSKLEEVIPLAKERGVGIINAAPFSARLLTNLPLPAWHGATEEVRAVARKASEACRAKGVDIAQVALQYSIENEDIATCPIGASTPEDVRKLAEWAEAPVDKALRAEVLEILAPIHNWHYVEGRVENNDGDVDLVRGVGG